VTIDRLVLGASSLVGEVELLDDMTFSGRASVARLRLRDGGTVVAKLAFDAGAHAREAAALQTLPESVRPQLLAAGAGVLVMEDLGPGPSLANLLLGDDPDAAAAALIAWARTLGATLRPSMRTGSAADPEAAGEGMVGLLGLAGDLGVTVPAAVEDDMVLVESVLARPGPWLAFCPGDTCPDNDRILPDGSVKLFDFEAAEWRHAALEGAYCRAPFCTCWCQGRLPEGMAQRMEAAFLAALAPPDPEAFVEAIALASVHFVLLTFRWMRRWVGEGRALAPKAPATGPQYAYERLHTLAALGERLPALSAVARELAGRVVDRWPDATAMPAYPAFAGLPAAE